jgi:ribosomal protein S21
MPSVFNVRKDDIVVYITEGANTEKALRKFSVMWKNSGRAREPRFREQNPSRSSRRKEKDRRAVSRRMRGTH